MTSTERRRLGGLTLAALVAANMIGAGVFTSSGFALADLGSPGRVLAAWVLGGVVAVLGALSYGALAARISESGGEYTFLSRTLHPSIGFLAGWVSIWAGFTGAIALAAEAAQGYLAPWLPEALPLDVVGTAVIVATGIVHARGVAPGVWFQNGVVVLKLLLLAGLVAVGASRLAPTEGAAPEPLSAGAFVVSMMWISLSYSGWNAAVYVAGEVREPRRTLPRAMLGGTLLVTALYLALNAVFVHAGPFEELAGQKDIAAVAAGALGGDGLEVLVRVVLVVALVTSISSMVMIGPRVIAKMADDGLLPRALAFTGATPASAIGAQVLLSVGILWASGLREQLTNLGWILGLFTALTVVGLFRLRAREGAERVPVPGYPFVPLAFLAIVFALTGAMVAVRGSQLVPSGVVLATGVGAYLLGSSRGRGASST